MADKEPVVTAFLPQTAPVFHVLVAVAESRKHGYEILKEIEERTEGRVHLPRGEST